MREAERGILMLTCALGEKDAQPLAGQQFFAVGELVRRSMPRRGMSERLCREDLLQAGVSEDYAAQILRLLDRDARLDRYLDGAERAGVRVVTILSESYPKRLKERLGSDAPTALFCKGDLTLLQSACVSLVGSRRLGEQGRAFAESVGVLAAKNGFTLASGGANGADRTAQTACRRAGGNVLVFTPERLPPGTCPDRVLFVSEGGYQLPFTSERALSRNRLIHAMGEKTFVAQCACGHGGTWRGSVQNLRYGYSPLVVCDDGTRAAAELAAAGATAVSDPKDVF